MDRERLFEAEEEQFRRLMLIMAEQEGQRLLELNERLKNDPAAQVPEEIDQSCRALIRIGAAGPYCRLWLGLRNARRKIRRMFGRR